MMQKSIINFVEQYKALFALPKHEIEFTKKDYVEILIAFAIIIAVFGLLGWLTHRLNNIYYVIFTVNTTILLTFLLIRAKQHLKSAQQTLNNKDFQILVFVEMVHLLAILGLFQVILFLVYFKDIIAVSFYIVVLLLSISSTALTIYLKRQVGLNRANIINISIWLLFSFLALFYLLPFELLLSKYVLSTVIVTALYCYKHILNKIEKDNVYEKIVMVILIIIIGIMVILNFLNFLNAIGFLMGYDNYLTQEIIKSHQNLLLSKPLMLLILTLCVQVNVEFSLNKRGETYA